MDELYGVYSLGHPSDYPAAFLEEDNRVELEWFCMDRTQPIAPYETLIIGYVTLEEPAKLKAQRYMDEHFTRDEGRRLLPYLCFTYGHLVGIRVIPVPMDIWLAEGQSLANPVSTILASGGWTLAHTLSHEAADYPLPFQVSAYYQRQRA